MSTQPSTQPVFVVGIWRSGTSLLYALLNQHPQIALMYESDLLLLSPLFARGKSQGDWRQRWDFWNAGLTRHKLDRSRIPDEMPNLATAMEVVFREYAAGAAIWGCKSPSYYDRLTELGEMFPGARFVVIWRDPAGICQSILRAGEKNSWFGKTGMLGRALLGNLEMKKGCDQLVSRGCKVHQLYYEELIRDPVANMMAICDFLRIPYEPRMSTLQGADRSAIFSHEHHALVKGEAIVSDAPKAEVLQPRLKKKIERYVNYWKKQHGGTWPAYPQSTQTGGDPSGVERAIDRVAFDLFRAWDRVVARIYCSAPLPLLAVYRRARESIRSSAQDQDKEAEDALRSVKADAS
jgi:hypothetical protein